MVDKDALEWHKARIAYLEGVRADLARQLESGESLIEQNIFMNTVLIISCTCSSMSTLTYLPRLLMLILSPFLSISLILERLARRTEVDQLEDKAHQQLRAAQALLSREREQRVQAEQAVREEMAEEVSAANRAAIDALDRADEVTARCRSLESKVTRPYDTTSCFTLMIPFQSLSLVKSSTFFAI